MSAGAAWRWEGLDSSAAWNSGAGPQLQWLGASSRYFVFNDVQCDRPVDGSGTARAAQSGGCRFRAKS